MKSLTEQLSAYSAYHHDPRNTLTHYIGVPLVILGLSIPLSWLRFYPDPAIPYTGCTLFYVTVFIYYLCLDWRVALLQAPFTLTLLWLADRIALWPFQVSLLAFLAAFAGGCIIQLVGHAFEGKRPALADNVLQIFNAPLFLTVEALLFLGYRKDLRAGADTELAPVDKPLFSEGLFDQSNLVYFVSSQYKDVVDGHYAAYLRQSPGVAREQARVTQLESRFVSPHQIVETFLPSNT
jgi:uncharacterized membrane protein YGL010W